MLPKITVGSKNFEKSRKIHHGKRQELENEQIPPKCNSRDDFFKHNLCPVYTGKIDKISIQSSLRKVLEKFN